MCGIAGFLLSDSCSDESAISLLQGMSSQLVHRGPDDVGLWFDSSLGVGVCHRRLSILDLTPSGHQPMASPCERWQLVFNGEIYNHNELRYQLEQRGLSPSWRGHSDTETLLAALAIWGVEATLPRLIGMFAFALWDRQERRLTLARDRFGEKPLYYAFARSKKHAPMLLFASELPALMVHPGYDRSIDRRATALFLRHSYIPAPWSIHEQTRKLRPGCSVTIRTDDLHFGLSAVQSHEHVFWNALSCAQFGLTHPFEGSIEQGIDTVAEKLHCAVARQTLADVPIGAFLSGGIDSSLVAALLQSQSLHRVNTFSIGFDDSQFNEAPYAKAVARHLGTDHSELIVTEYDALDIIPVLPSIYGEPFADSSQIPTVLLSRLARQKVTVSLSGDGGDELFGGYNRYLTGAALWDKTKLLPSMVRSIILAATHSRAVALVPRLLKFANFLSLGIGRHQDMSAKIDKLMHVLGSSSSQELYCLLVSHWSNTDNLVIGASEYQPAISDCSLWLHSADFRHQMMLLDTLTYLPDDILVKVDRAAMSTSLETRIPFLDPDLFALAWSLPLNHKISSRTGKLPLRAVLSRYLPQHLIDRPKMGFGVPLASWLRGPLSPWAESLLDHTRLTQQGLLNVSRVRNCWKSHLNGTIDAKYQLWSILCLQSWIDYVQTVEIISCAP